MKKMIIALVALFTFAASANAMSYEQARQQALFLTDKMAYELNLTEEQYEAAFEVNLDYLMSVNTQADLYGIYWQQRNLDLSYILLDWQYRAFVDATYFYRPLYWEAGYWHFGIYARYPHRDFFYFGRPHFYTVYRGGHSWRMNGGRSYYHGRTYVTHTSRDRHVGMHDRFERGDFGRGQRGLDNRRDNRSVSNGNRSFGNGNRPNNGNQPNRQGNIDNRRSSGSNRTFGNGNSGGNRSNINSSSPQMNNSNQQGNRSFGGRSNTTTTRPSTTSPSTTTPSATPRNFNQSSTRTTVTRPNTGSSSSSNRHFGNSSSSAPRSTFTPSRSSSSSSSAPSRSISTPSRSSSSSAPSRSFSSPSRSSSSSSMGRFSSSPSRSSSGGGSRGGGGHFGGRR